MNQPLNHPTTLDSTAAANHSHTSRSFTRFLPPIARLPLGISLLVFGLNVFLDFIPPPEGVMSEKALSFAAALAEAVFRLAVGEGRD